MFLLLIWAIFGLLTGGIAKRIHPGDTPIGLFPTITIGIAGSFIGGVINLALGFGKSPFHPAGFLMSILGGVLCCAAYRWYTLKMSSTGPKSFFTGKNLK